MDEQLKLLAKNWSEGVVKQAVWLSRIVDCERAHEILEKMGQISISTSSIWRQVQVWGEQFRELERKERLRASALPVKWVPTTGKVEQVGRMGVAMDGGMIHIELSRDARGRMAHRKWYSRAQPNSTRLA